MLSINDGEQESCYVLNIGRYDVVFIFHRKRLVKRRQGHRRKRDDTMMVTSSSVKFNRHHHQHTNNHHENWTVSLLMTLNRLEKKHM